MPCRCRCRRRRRALLAARPLLVLLCRRLLPRACLFVVFVAVAFVLRIQFVAAATSLLTAPLHARRCYGAPQR